MRVFLGVTTVIIDQVWRGFQGIISVEENLMCSCIGKLWPLVFSSKQRYIHAVPLVEIHSSVKCQGQNLFFFCIKRSACFPIVLSSCAYIIYKKRTCPHKWPQINPFWMGKQQSISPSLFANGNNKIQPTFVSLITLLFFLKKLYCTCSEEWEMITSNVEFSQKRSCKREA